MWVIAGVLLGLVIVVSVVGFHSGPHTHAAAGVLGVVAAAWLVFMAFVGRSAPVLWTVLSLDLVLSAGLAVMAWYGLARRGSVHRALAGHRLVSLEGAEGVAVGDLRPEGIVRVRGEQWSAVSVNGPVRAGTPVHVLRATGVHLEVWGEDVEVALGAGGGRSALDEGEKKERST